MHKYACLLLKKISSNSNSKQKKDGEFVTNGKLSRSDMINVQYRSFDEFGNIHSKKKY